MVFIVGVLVSVVVLSLSAASDAARGNAHASAVTHGANNITACTTLNSRFLDARSGVAVSLINLNDPYGCFIYCSAYQGDFGMAASGPAVDVHFAGDKSCPSDNNFRYQYVQTIPDNDDGYSGWSQYTPYNPVSFQPVTEVVNNWVLYSTTVTGTICQSILYCTSADGTLVVPRVGVKVEEIKWDDLGRKTTTVVPEHQYTVTLK